MLQYVAASILQKVTPISSLELHSCSWGYGADSYDFEYFTRANGHVIPGGRLTYTLLSPFALHRRTIDYEHGLKGLQSMRDALGWKT